MRTNGSPHINPEPGWRNAVEDQHTASIYALIRKRTEAINGLISALVLVVTLFGGMLVIAAFLGLIWLGRHVL